RLARLIEVTDSLSRASNERCVGEALEVLIEGVSKRSTRLMGRTRQNQPVVFPGDPAWAGELRRVQIARANTWTLEGEVL
ncbi:Deoxyribonuclease/rho motif-related TRAM domain protein, partial [mine drainage metagenome]